MIKGYEKYPIWIVLLSNLINFSVWFSGIYLVSLVNIWLGLIFFLYIVYMELKVCKVGCVNCYYYGKRCGFGKGSLSSLFFKKGDSKKFGERSFSFKDFIPSLLISIIPIIFGVYLLINKFDWFVLILTIWPVLIWFLSNPIIYGKLICPNCKQRGINCLACEYFKKF